MIVSSKHIRFRGRISLLYVLLLGYCLLYTGYVFSDQNIALSSSVDKTRIKIGDIITYRVKVVHDESIELKMPGPGANLGGFEIRDYQELKPRKENADIISEAEYSISTFTTGNFVIPPLEVHYKEESDTAYKKLQTRKIEIKVESMKPSEEGDIRDIKSPVELPYIWWNAWGKWAVLGLGILLLAAAAYFVYRRKKMGRSIIPQKVPPPRPPHEVALEALERIKKSRLLETGEIKQYYTEISEILRTYFEGRYYIPALERTSGEIMKELEVININEDVYELIQEVLLTSDMVKFAKVIPGSETDQKILQKAYQVVEQTKVVPMNEDTDVKDPSDHKNNNSEDQEKESVKQGAKEPDHLVQNNLDQEKGEK